MSVSAFFKCKKTIKRLHLGPLGTYIGAYADHLVAEGHYYQSGARNIRVAANFSAEVALAKVAAFNKHNVLFYKPSDTLLNFLTSL